MGFLNKIFSKKEQPISSYADFWKWFQKNEKSFYKAVKTRSNVERDFFDKLSPKLRELKEGYYYLTGMYNDHTAELVFTAEGAIKNIVFVEELVNAAPQLKNWKFTALKPASDADSVQIEMGGYSFGKENISFYSNDDADFPDEIDLTIVHNDYTEENKGTLAHGSYIFIDNFLGELNFATTIDALSIKGKDKAAHELIPIEKLKGFLNWRQKEFIEKSESVRHDTVKDNYATLEARLQSGNPLLAVINTDLLRWDGKASHPWILNVTIKFSASSSGMPAEGTYELLNNIEQDITAELKDYEGYLNIGRQTAEGAREIYFACKDFRRPSKVVHAVAGKYAAAVEISYEIYKDKYWRSFDRFHIQ